MWLRSAGPLVPSIGEYPPIWGIRPPTEPYVDELQRPYVRNLVHMLRGKDSNGARVCVTDLSDYIYRMQISRYARLPRFLPRPSDHLHHSGSFRHCYTVDIVSWVFTRWEHISSCYADEIVTHHLREPDRNHSLSKTGVLSPMFFCDSQTKECRIQVVWHTSHLH